MQGAVNYFVETDEVDNLIYIDYDGEVVPNVDEIVLIDDVYYEVEVIIINPVESSVSVILEEMD